MWAQRKSNLFFTEKPTRYAHKYGTRITVGRRLSLPYIIPARDSRVLRGGPTEDQGGDTPRGPDHTADERYEAGANAIATTSRRAPQYRSGRSPYQTHFLWFAEAERHTATGTRNTLSGALNALGICRRECRTPLSPAIGPGNSRPRHLTPE